MSNSQLSIYENRCFFKVLLSLDWIETHFLQIISQWMHFMSQGISIFTSLQELDARDPLPNEMLIEPIVRLVRPKSGQWQIRTDAHRFITTESRPLAVLIRSLCGSLDLDSITVCFCFCFPLYRTGQKWFPHDWWFWWRFCDCQCIRDCVLQKIARQNPILMSQNTLFVVLVDYVLHVVTKLNPNKGIVQPKVKSLLQICIFF